MKIRLSGVSRWTMGLATIAVLLGTGCAQEVGDINRVQPNALAKSDFTDSEWYIRQTVTDVSSSSYVSFVGLTGGMEKIRWEITEDYLIAYRSYESNPGAEGDVVRNEDGELVFRDDQLEGYSGDYRESPIAAYPISSHFDIQRSYNSSTGEQSNVISENSSDRPWYERDYFRVDWTNRLSNNTMLYYDFLGDVDFYVQDSEGTNDSFRIEYFDRNNIDVPDVAPTDYDQGAPYYMDFTNRVLVDGSMVQYCFGGYSPFMLDDCGSSEMEVRTSILRVPNTTEYEPIIYDELDM
ncbi:MAG: hypothetical protein KC561_17415, partial [Myxococcales bacterium]|nr:hypothetical protein [Myxococcales bacterium]